MTFCADLQPHSAHPMGEESIPGYQYTKRVVWCEGRVSHGLEAWGDIIDEIDSREHEAEISCDKFDRTHYEEAETF